MKPGFHEIPVGLLVPKWANEIYQKRGWEGMLMETLTKPGLGRGGRRVEGLREDDVLSLQGVGMFSPGLPAHDALVRLLYRFFFSLGIFKRYPAVVGYQNVPFLTLERCIDRMMSAHVKWPTMDSLGGNQSFTIEALAASLPTIIRRMATLSHLRKEMISRFRLKLGAIGRKISLKQPIDQAELSAYVRFGISPQNIWGWTEEEIANKAQPIIYSAETGDPLVTENWELFKASTEQGPYLRFAKLTSNKSIENLVYTFSPQIAALAYQIGYVRAFGPFDEPDTREAVTLPWTREDQLIAARERALSYELGTDNVMTLQPPIQAGVRGAPDFEPQWDIPEVQFTVDISKTRIMPTEISFYSKWRKRTMLLSNGATPETLLMDIALLNDGVGEGLMDKSSLKDFGFIDTPASREYLNKQAPVQPNYDEEILYPKSGGGNVTKVTVPMGPFYSRMGTTMYMPAFREFAYAPMHWLSVPDKEAEDYICARLALTYEQRLQAEKTIRISHNYSKLKRLLSVDQLPITEAKLLALCTALVGGGSSV
jgi:hypothetical protein